MSDKLTIAEREEQRQNKLVRALQSFHDFSIAASAAIFLKEADDDKKYPMDELRRFKCYETTAIVSYARPFSQSKGKLPRLSLKDCGVSFSVEEESLHQKLLELRNKLIAHSDEEFVGFTAFAFNDETELKDQLQILDIRGDEGIQFHSYRDRVHLIDLILKVHFSLYRRLWEDAQNEPERFRISKFGIAPVIPSKLI